MHRPRAHWTLLVVLLIAQQRLGTSHTTAAQQRCWNPWHPLPVELCCAYVAPQVPAALRPIKAQQCAAQAVTAAAPSPQPLSAPSHSSEGSSSSSSSSSASSSISSSSSGGSASSSASASSSRLPAPEGVCDASVDINSCEAEAEGQYIVRFNDYQLAAAQRQRLRNAVGPESAATWRWVPRHNSASAHPTDFGLVSVTRGALPTLRQGLSSKGSSFFRDLHPDKRMTGKLKWQPEGALASAFMDSNLGGLGSTGKQEAEVWQHYPQHQQQQRQTRTLLQQPADTQQPGSAPAPAPTHTSADIADPSTAGGMQDAANATANATPADQSMEELLRVSKPPGRLTTRSTFGLDDDMDHAELRRMRRRRRGRALQQLKAGSGVAAQLQADKIWAQGYTGQKVKVGVFDTGIRLDHPHIRHIKQRTNWTHQSSLSDGLGHGTFVAGVIGSQDTTCPGLAPDVELYTFKVFTDDQVSYTSWFLDAFNYAIMAGINVINLSIGGPDFLDHPFVEKVWEVTSNGAIMISAIGNDGPLYGTLNNPADQNDVIGVGGIDNSDNIASFSSRGMTTWELPIGTGRIKPDVMAYGKDVYGSKIQGGCRSLSGTSVASPVVAGAVALLASTVPEEGRWELLNPASMKQALVEGCVRLPKLNVYEQGAGRINLANSQAILKDYKPRASVVPASLDLTDCPFMWPYCKQPLYAYALPLAFNATLLNGMGVSGRVVEGPVFEPADEGGRLLQLTFEHSTLLWPWSGYLAIYLQVSPAGRTFSGIATGTIKVTIESPPLTGGKETAPRRSTIEMPVRARVEPTPPRSKRVLWDQFHSIKYPPGYVPRDNLDIKTDILDWHGDHLFTNFHDLYDNLRNKGWFVEVLSSPATCFDARNYGAYLIVDSEDEWYPEEVAKLQKDVAEHGLALIVFAEWYHLDSMLSMKFFDDNTRSWWTPVTGGSNVPALNDLLAPYGIALGDAVLQGPVSVGGTNLQQSYGANIARFPAGGYLFTSTANNVVSKGQGGTPGPYAGFGLTTHEAGTVAVFGDANCLDSSHSVSQCFDFLHSLLQAATDKAAESPLKAAAARIDSPYSAQGHDTLPQRRADINFTRHSWVLQHPATCYRNAPCAYRSPKDCPDASAWQSLVHDLSVPVDSTSAGGKAPGPVPAKGAAPAAAPKSEGTGEGASRPVATGSNRETTAAQTPPGDAPAVVGLEGSSQGSQSGGAGTGGGKTTSGGSVSPVPVKGWKPALWHQEHTRTFISQAMALATGICIVGVVGIIVLWRKNGLKKKPLASIITSSRRLASEV